MHSTITTVFSLILLICCAHSLSATRIPMEIVEVSSTQVTSDEKKLNRHKTSISDVIDNSSSSSINNSNNGHSRTDDHTEHSHSTSATTNSHQIIEQRKGRQITEPVHTPRILYQVGTTENDLPICAPNAVCSKIDLYETPWIERQCRCPKPALYNGNKHYHTIYHAKEQKLNGNARNTNYRHLLEQKWKLSETFSDHSDYDPENEHIKTLLQKLGVIYNQDDILATDADYNDYDLRPVQQQQQHQQQQQQHYPYKKKFDGSHNAVISDLSGGTKFRHTGHRDVARIGGCPSSISLDDGHTIADKTRLYKLCEPVHKLPLCRYFRDYTWTLKSSPLMNVTEQVVRCRCPKNSVSYLIKREPLQTGTMGYTYLFACSPQSRLKCQRKEPCKLFTVRKRQEYLDEVNTNPLCQCPRNHRCPRHHTDSGVILGKSYIEDNIRTYSGYCMPDI